MSETTPDVTEKVGFRDIYRAVGESESRIKEHISLALIPFATQLADHEHRLINHEGRITVIETSRVGDVAAGVERRRIGGITNKVLGIIILVTNFIIGVLVVAANFFSTHS